MTADRDPDLDSILAAPSDEAWRVIFDQLWEIFSAPLTPQHASVPADLIRHAASGQRTVLAMPQELQLDFGKQQVNRPFRFFRHLYGVSPVLG
jgi:hypothetical protein